MPSTPKEAPIHRYVLFSVVSIALFMSSIDQTIVATALPTIDRELDASLNWSGWIITVYSLGRIVVQPIVGRLGAGLGQRRIFIFAISLFSIASLLCGLANSMSLLIGLRALQAIGGAAFIPTATGIVAGSFGANRDRAVGLFSSITPIGAIVGPVLGGVMLSSWSWRGIFLVNVPVGLVLIVLAQKFVPDGTSHPVSRVDFPGIMFLCLTLLGGTMAITYLGESSASLGNVRFLGPLAVALVTGGLLLRHARAVDAILPIRLLYGRGFGVMNLINFLFGSSALGFGALVPLYGQNRYGMSSLAAGTMLTARGVGMIAVAAIAVFALRRTGYRRPMMVGYGVSSLGLMLLALSPPGPVSPYMWLAGSATVIGLGTGAALPASNSASFQLDPSQVSAIAGLRSTFRQVGSITAVSVTTALLARSADPGLSQAHVFVAFAVILLGVLPLVRLVPEHRSAW